MPIQPLYDEGYRKFVVVHLDERKTDRYDDAVKNAGRHVPIIWEDEELEMGTFADSESRFFVRTDEKDEAAIKAVFGDVEYVDSDLDEKAFVTAVITEGEFEACCNKIGVKSALRVLD